jgi:hypothetical protein
MVLGEKPSSSFTFKRPGPNHHARWMSKIIYVFKMYLLRDELGLEAATEKHLHELSMFYSLVYVKAWMMAPQPADAPFNDLLFYNQLFQFKKINDDLAHRCSNSILRVNRCSEKNEKLPAIDALENGN